MKEDFDIASQTYDQDFTLSNIGLSQRRRVWKYLDEYLHGKEKLDILELNCGTGEDARRFHQRGHSVLASDISTGMLEQARSKFVNEDILFDRIDLKEISEYKFKNKFDLVFSNFGGLNCISPKDLTDALAIIKTILKDQGRFIAVIMPDRCLMETLFYKLKGDHEKAARRRKEFVMANVSGENVKTWYYAPSNVVGLAGKSFKQEKVKPIGLFIPPSYLESFLKPRLGLLKVLEATEELIGHFDWQGRWSDHFYIQLRLT